MLIHETVADYAAKTPEKTAVCDPRGKYSYKELWALSANASRKIVSSGAGEGNAVAVYVPFSKDIVLGAFCAWRAGCIFLPFDSAYPEERLNYMLENSEAAIILTVHEIWDIKPLEFGLDKVIFMDDLKPDDTPFDCPYLLTDDSPAMLLYTSGTTGRPKGVLHRHAMLANLLDFMDVNEGNQVDENSYGGVATGFTFVATQVFMFGTLSKGGTVCIAPEEARRDLGFLNRFLKESKITHIFLPSSLGAVLAEDYDIRGVYVMVGGEKLRPFTAYIPGNCLYLGYGCTETGGIMVKKVFGNEERLLIGKPSKSTSARIIDDELKTVPTGEVGELIISSPFISQGYFKLPELTAEKWIKLDGAVWFRTGDRCRCTKDGDHDILGRSDNMVKLRGFRIEIGEVEVQAANAAISIGRGDVKTFVVTLKTVGGMDHLVCYYESDRELDQSAVIKEASKYLAEYMVPDIWMRMDTLPRNVNGKVMRSELPQPERNRGQIIYGALDSEVLARFVYTLQDIVGTEVSFGPDDRFTDLGGTSLTAMRYTTLLREQGIKVSSEQVLKLNTIRKIAEAADVIYEQLWTRDEYEGIRSDFALRNEHIQKVLPITPEQDDMLFKQIIYPDRFNFKNTVFLQVDSPLKEAELRKALDTVAGEYEELRAAIVFHDVPTIQQVITDRKIPLEFIHSGIFGPDEMRELRNRLLYMPMDPQRDSLMRVVYLQTGSINMLCIVTHSIAFSSDKRNAYVARLMRLLEDDHPKDEAIRGWRELLEESLNEDNNDQNTAAADKGTGISDKIPPEMCVYSENAGPKVVFVHTGNTGSAAYYRLAARIGDKVSFSVIEPFNLYHPDEAGYGIKQIAKKYIEILKRHQPEGPYILGGWCYGGIVAHEMACQLENTGEKVGYLFMLDSHTSKDARARKILSGMNADVNRSYFETSPLFSELRESGMLESIIVNSEHVKKDILDHNPDFFHGNTIYFKPDSIPAGISEESKRYWKKMMEYEAGNYENYCDRDKLKIVHTPHEHDLMMDDQSLDIIVPELMKAISKCE